MGGAGQPVAAGHGLVLHEGDDGDVEPPGLLLDVGAHQVALGQGASAGVYIEDDGLKIGPLEQSAPLSFVEVHRGFALIGQRHSSRYPKPPTRV